MAQDKRQLGIRTFVILAVILVLGAFVVIRMRDQGSKPSTDVNGSPVSTGDAKADLAQCLTDKGVKMYGASWCPHCAQQKKAFGSAFKLVTYVECAIPGDSKGQTQICKDNNIQGYPTWRFPTGDDLTGEQTLDELATRAGCSYGDTPAPTPAPAGGAAINSGDVPAVDANVSAGGPRTQ